MRKLESPCAAIAGIYHVWRAAAIFVRNANTRAA